MEQAGAHVCIAQLYHVARQARVHACTIWGLWQPEAAGVIMAWDCHRVVSVGVALRLQIVMVRVLSKAGSNWGWAAQCPWLCQLQPDAPQQHAWWCHGHLDVMCVVMCVVMGGPGPALQGHQGTYVRCARQLLC
jgi:hypothetical protein